MKTVREYRRLNDNQIKEKIEYLSKELINTYYKTKKENRKRIRKEIAKLKTIQNEKQRKKSK